MALEERFAELLPEVLLGVDPARFAELAAAVLRPRPPPTVGIDHLHAPTVSVPEQVAILRERLRRAGAGDVRRADRRLRRAALEVVARFLAVLELFREAAVALDQPECFGELTVRWTRRAGVTTGSRHRRAGARIRAGSDRRRDGDDDRRADRRRSRAADDAALEAGARGAAARRRHPHRGRRARRRAGAAGRPGPGHAHRDGRSGTPRDGRGIDLRRVGGGWRFYTRDTYAPYVERLLLDGQRAKLTRAALETLAVVAYRQPVTRARVAAVRGVNCDGVLRTLVTRGLIKEAGVDGATQGTLFRTTELFLERLGLTSVDDLPPLAPLLPDVDAIDAIDAGLDTGRGQ